jgi:hypothetical protein
MASHAGLFGLASLLVLATQVCVGVDPVFPQVPDVTPGATEGDPETSNPQAADSPDVYGSLGLNFAVAIPRGEFSSNVGTGLGLTGDLSFRLVPSGWLGLRIDGGVIWYGHESHTETVVLRSVPVELEVTTENTIVQGAIGPQLYFAGYPLTARLYGLVGMSRFATTSSVSFKSEDLEDSDVHLESTNHLSDWTPSLTIGGGIRWTFFGDRDGFLAGVGLDVEWRGHGTTRYLVEGSITEVDGRAEFTPLESRADFFLISLGVWIGTW